jgi:hypothetical protein
VGTHQHRSRLDVATVVDVKTSKSVSPSDGVGDPAVVRFRRFLAVEVFGRDGGHVGVHRHVFRNCCPKKEAVEPKIEKNGFVLEAMQSFVALNVCHTNALKLTQQHTFALLL